MLILAWTAGYCLLCLPAHAAVLGPVLTDERLFSFFTWAPFLIVALLLLAFCWRERGTAKVTGDETAVASGAEVPVRRRTADRG
ncbi:hypothetical protein [Lichenibacterium dinghuense]|uniref:hypothetical protein n=1 Tax=Lichenibacterium dinghuense TaxID=2895977 RepID=UPI001F41F601|nr:hypothetical protein [Lichenibacterium sp. 6Y81]